MRLSPLLLVLDNIEHVVSAGRTSCRARASRADAVHPGKWDAGFQPQWRARNAPSSTAYGRRSGNSSSSARVRSRAPTIPVEDDRAAIVRICAALEGLKLAIELAAMRTRSLTPSQMAERIWELLSQGPQDYTELGIKR